MTALLLSVHVLAAILTVGPVAVTASMFPPAARRALAAPDDANATASARLLHRVTRVYAIIGVAVPVFGYATGASLGVLSDAWLVASMVLTAAAAAVLIVLVLPGQRRVLDALDGVRAARPGAAATPAASGGAGGPAAVAAAGDPEGSAESGAPAGSEASAESEASPATRRLAMHAGIFNLLWAVVVVLMIYRPGSTTGAGL